MQRGGRISKLVIVLLFCLPATALADAGTPLMWAGAFHLVIGNALIGGLEGLLLAWMFRLNPWGCVAAMIPANYFSAWCGDVFLLRYALKDPPNQDLYNAWQWVWMMVGVTFLLTCVLEWPFVFFCLRKSDHRLKKSIWGNLLVQAVSYVLLFGWYWAASGRSLYTRAHIVQPVAFPVPTNSVLYFISTNNNIYSMTLPDGTPQKISNVSYTNRQDRLFLRESEPGKFNIFVRLDISPIANDFQLVLSNLNAVATVPENEQKEDLNHIPSTWLSDGRVTTIGSATNSAWEFQTGFWPIGGLSGENHQTRERLDLAFETPFAAWNIRHGYQLPGDCVVFQLGEDQICILDPKTRRVALVARGHGPVVVLE